MEHSALTSLSHTHTHLLALLGGQRIQDLPLLLLELSPQPGDVLPPSILPWGYGMHGWWLAHLFFE